MENPLRKEIMALESRRTSLEGELQLYDHDDPKVQELRGELKSLESEIEHKEVEFYWEQYDSCPIP